VVLILLVLVLPFVGEIKNIIKKVLKKDES